MVRLEETPLYNLVSIDLDTAIVIKDNDNETFTTLTSMDLETVIYNDIWY